MDYFKEISDWRDEDERGQHHVYRRFEGVVDTSFGPVAYSGVERDWFLAGNTPAQNRELGRCFVVRSLKPDVIAWSCTEREAIENLSETIDAYIFG